MDINATGRFIAELRKQKGYTQKELAEKLTVTDKAVSRWETGKGLPDTALLKPLGDLLGVSVNELLAGRRIGEEELKDRTDRVLLEALDYSKRTVADTAGLFLFLAGLVLMLAPLFLAGAGGVWVLGPALAAAAALYTCTRRRGHPMKIANRTWYLAAVLLAALALCLELLPRGVVMIFAAGPEERITELCSYFSLLPVGYANVTPLLTGLLTAAVLLLGLWALLRPSGGARLRKAAFVCSIAALLLSPVPRLLFGPAGMNGVSWAVSGLLLLSACLQAVANRKD